MILGVYAPETELAGDDALISKMVMQFDPATDTYDWSKVIVDAGDINVYYTASDQRVLVNWLQWGSGNTQRRLRARSPIARKEGIHSEGDSRDGRRRLWNRKDKKLSRPVSAFKITRNTTFNGLN